MTHSVHVQFIYKILEKIVLKYTSELVQPKIKDIRSKICPELGFRFNNYIMSDHALRPKYLDNIEFNYQNILVVYI